MELANRCASRLASELGLPSFLYAAACVKGEYRRTLPQLREGQYEALPTKLKDPRWTPYFLMLVSFLRSRAIP